ncbi:MAG TPA: hypothetical protein ENH29_10685, partial [Bacteroidetes bacterium]|nr:hypothetical protein [Bacteroidota bacterium]
MAKKMVSVVFFSLFFIFSSIAAREIKKDFHKSFDVGEGAVLILHHGDGDVTVLPWDKDVIDVTVRYRLEYKSIGIGNRHDFDVEFRQNGEKVYVIGKERGSGISIGVQYSRRYEYTYKIRAPKYVELEFTGDDGDVEIDDRQGNIFLTLDDGNVDLSNIAADK